MSLQPISFNSEEQGGLRNKQLLALVVDNVDPDKRRRIKIRIRGLHRNIDDADLYWVKCDMGFGVAGNAPGVGSIGLPPIGSKIWVNVLDAFGRSIKVIGPAYQEDDKTDELETNDYDAYGFVDPGGNKFFISPKDNTVEFTHVTGTRFLIKANGEVEIVSANNIGIHANGVLNLRGQSVNVESQGEIKLQGTQVKINESAGSPGVAPLTVTARQKPTPRDVKNKTDF